MPATSGASSPKPATPKKSPKKKATKLRVQAEGENVYFENGAQKPVAAGAEDGASDPLAEYRAAAAIAAKAIQQEKERESERQAHLLAVWDAMDRVSTGQGAGRVDMADVVEAVAKGSPTHTARSARAFARSREFCFSMRRQASCTSAPTALRRRRHQLSSTSLRLESSDSPRTASSTTRSSRLKTAEHCCGETVTTSRSAAPHRLKACLSPTRTPRWSGAMCGTTIGRRARRLDIVMTYHWHTRRCRT